jgi:hypothetical protein
VNPYRHSHAQRAQDHFYICRGHLKDRGFASPIVNQAEEDAKKKKEALDREIALIKKEYEEKAAKKAKSKDKKDAGKDSDDKKKEETDDDAKKGEKEMNDKVGSIGFMESLPFAERRDRFKPFRISSHPPVLMMSLAYMSFTSNCFSVQVNCRVLTVQGTFFKCVSTAYATPKSQNATESVSKTRRHSHRFLAEIYKSVARAREHKASLSLSRSCLVLDPSRFFALIELDRIPLVYDLVDLVAATIPTP